jgi:hypothetical protein
MWSCVWVWRWLCGCGGGGGGRRREAGYCRGVVAQKHAHDYRPELREHSRALDAPHAFARNEAPQHGAWVRASICSLECIWARIPRACTRICDRTCDFLACARR